MNNTLQHKGYYAEIHFSSEDETFYGKLIGINDLVNFEADSVKGLKKACAEAVEDYLDTCKAIKKSPGKKYKGSFNVRIPSEFHRQAAIFASLKKVSLNDYVKFALSEIISNETRGTKSKSKAA
jgi:predicted HicB family RNase H-like nuclease